MMHARTLALILSAVLLSASGQVMLKTGASRIVAGTNVEFLFAAARDARIVLGLIAWIASTTCWLFVLRVTPLSRAYGLTSLTYVVIFLASVFMLGEQVRRLHVFGTALIVVGISCLLAGD